MQILDSIMCDGHYKNNVKLVYLEYIELILELIFQRGLIKSPFFQRKLIIIQKSKITRNNKLYTEHEWEESDT